MLAALIMAATVPNVVAPGPALAVYLRDTLKVDRFRWAEADLDGDGRAEQFVYVLDSQWCGSGGCVLFVLARHGKGWRTVLRTTVTRPPILVLQDRSHGWHDIAVGVGGGGSAAGVARLRFDGAHYAPANPTLAPMVRAGGKAKVLLAL